MPDTPPPLELDNPFWGFSCAVYAMPGVQEACLALQDRFGLDVNLALLCAWVGAARGGKMEAGDLAAAAALVAEWQGEVVRPLRGVRRRIKEVAAGDPAIAALRESVAGAELGAEQVQQAILFRWADPRWPGHGVAPPGDGAALRNLGLLPDPAEADAAASALAALAQAAERHAGLGLSAR